MRGVRATVLVATLGLEAKGIAAFLPATPGNAVAPCCLRVYTLLSLTPECAVDFAPARVSYLLAWIYERKDDSFALT